MTVSMVMLLAKQCFHYSQNFKTSIPLGKRKDASDYVSNFGLLFWFNNDGEFRSFCGLFYCLR